MQIILINIRNIAHFSRFVVFITHIDQFEFLSKLRFAFGRIALTSTLDELGNAFVFKIEIVLVCPCTDLLVAADSSRCVGIES